MKHFLRLITAILALVVFLIAPKPTWAETENTADDSVRQKIYWTNLTFEGSKLGTDIHLQIQLHSTAESSETPGETGDTVTLTVRSSSKSIGFKRRKYEEHVVFNSTTLQPSERTRINGTSEKWIKQYFWEKEGVRREKILPGNSTESKQPAGKWTDLSSSLYPYPENAHTCETKSDPLLLFYMVSSVKDARQSESSNICMFGKKQLHNVTIKQVKDSSLKTSYIRHTSSGEEIVEEKVSPVVYAIDGESFISKKSKQETFAVLGLHEDIRIYVHPENGLPLRVSGENNSMGKLVLNLTNVTVNSSGI